MTTKNVEIDIWTSDIERFTNDFEAMNDVKFDYMDITGISGADSRYTLEYRNFGDELQFPEQSYYQLKNSWEVSE